jgi:hypothetical protein
MGAESAWLWFAGYIAHPTSELLRILGCFATYTLHGLHVKIGPNRVLFWKVGFAQDPPTASWLMVVTHMLIFLV